MGKHWCMCTKLNLVARDCWSTCSICGGKDAYGKSIDRPYNKHKVLEQREDSPCSHNCKDHLVYVKGIDFYCPVCKTGYRR